MLASGSRRKHWCLFGCPREVAPGFRCGGSYCSTSAQACRTWCAMRRVPMRRSSTASFRHTDSAKNCMARCLMMCFRGCWIEISAGCSSEEHHQNTDDLVALRCVLLTGTARHERQQRGTVTIGNPLHRAFEPTATSTEVNTFFESYGFSCRFPALVLNRFVIQSRRGYHFESVSCRLSALVLNFSPLGHSEHCTGIALCRRHLKPP